MIKNGFFVLLGFFGHHGPIAPLKNALISRITHFEKRHTLPRSESLEEELHMTNWVLCLQETEETYIGSAPEDTDLRRSRQPDNDRSNKQAASHASHQYAPRSRR